MRSSYVATLGVASLFALGCADSSSNAPTDPGLEVRSTHLAAYTCISEVSRTAQAELKGMLAGDNLKAAQALWKTVEDNCSTTNHDQANGALMAYVAKVRSFYPAGFITPKAPATKEGNFLNHLNTVFPYVGYAAPSIPGGPTGPLQAGILGVIHATGGQREYQRSQLGAFELQEQTSDGDQRGHLFVMYPLSGDCLSVDNLSELGDCVRLSAFPAVSPEFDPAIKVGVCAEGVQSGHVLGHETSGGTEIAGEFAYPLDCHASIPGSVASVGTPLQNVMNRLASIGRRTLGIRPAYATDKGLGGIGSTLSDWGGINAQIFVANFDVPPNALDAPPVDVGNYTFTYEFANPGSILIKSSLGNVTGPLLVLSQGGGNCTACGGLYLRANFFSASGSAADDGTYDVNWTSVQASPSVKGAPFVVRSSDGLEIARLTYSTVSSKNYLTYNSTPLPDSLAWVRNVGQNFTITVDLDANTTTLKIGGVAVLTNQPFVNTAAQNLASFSAEFSGIDSGVMGVDAINVQRRSDQPPPAP